MNGIAHLAMFLPAAAMMIALPGPATVLVGARALCSKRKGLIAGIGMVAADLLLIGLSGASLAALRAHRLILLQMIEVGGGLALLYLGLAHYHSPPVADQAPPPAPRRLARGELANALLLGLSKPAPALFFAAFLPLFIERTASAPLRDFYALGALFEALSLLYLIALVLSRRATVYAADRIGPLAMHKLRGLGLILSSAFILLC